MVNNTTIHGNDKVVRSLLSLPIFFIIDYLKLMKTKKKMAVNVAYFLIFSSLQIKNLIISIFFKL
jgi:hypothetical protein